MAPFILRHTVLVKQKPDFVRSAWEPGSANPGQLLAARQIQNTPRPDCAFEKHVWRGFAGHVPDQGRLRRVRAHDFQGAVGSDGATNAANRPSQAA